MILRNRYRLESGPLWVQWHPWAAAPSIKKFGSSPPSSRLSKVAVSNTPASCSSWTVSSMGSVHIYLHKGIMEPIKAIDPKKTVLNVSPCQTEARQEWLHDSFQLGNSFLSCFLSVRFWVKLYTRLVGSRYKTVYHRCTNQIHSQHSTNWIGNVVDGRSH